MPRAPGEKFIVLFEAAKRSLLACGILVDRLAQELASMEPDIFSGLDVSERVASPLLSAVAFVDFAHRYGALVDAFPLLKKRAPELRRLKTALTTTELARNHLQHLRGKDELSTNVDIEYPVLGSLAWTNGDAAFLVAFSQPTPKMNLASIAFDTANMMWTAKHEYRVKDIRVNLDEVLRAMRSNYDWIVSNMTVSDPEFTKLQWGRTQAVGFRMPVSQTPVPPARSSSDTAAE